MEILPLNKRSEFRILSRWVFCCVPLYGELLPVFYLVPILSMVLLIQKQ